MSGESKRVGQLGEEVRIRGEKLRRVDVLTLLTELPDGALLTTSEAAVFLRRSVSKMERMRVDGNGPEYMQDPPPPGSKATNLAILYSVGALRAWAKKNTASHAMAHAALHGRTFATLMDAVEEVAFYVDDAGTVEGAVEDCTVAEVLEGLGRRRIQWMPAFEGASRPWKSLSAHNEFAGPLLQTLLSAKSAIEQSVEATDIAESVREAPSGTPRDF